MALEEYDLVVIGAGEKVTRAWESLTSGDGKSAVWWQELT